MLRRQRSREKVPARPTAVTPNSLFQSRLIALIRGYLSESKTVAEFRNGGFPYAYLVPPDQPQNTRCTLESRHYTTLWRGGFIHLLLVIALVVLLINLISGRRPVV